VSFIKEPCAHAYSNDVRQGITATKIKPTHLGAAPAPDHPRGKFLKAIKRDKYKKKNQPKNKKKRVKIEKKRREEGPNKVRTKF